MARKVLVSIVSEQTVPNVELIREFEKEVDKYIFITTDQMSEELDWITKATGIKNYDKINVIAFDTEDIENSINNYQFGEEEIILNITGGTKLMSLIVNEKFKDMGAVIYYVTGHNKTYIKVFPSRGERKFTLNYKLSLKEYLTAYGFEYKGTSPFKNFEMASQIFDFYISHDKEALIEVFEPVRIRRGRGMQVENLKLKDFLKEVKFNNINGKLTNKDTKYLSGDWFEEYVYFKIKEKLGLSEDEIATGINLHKEGTPNEIDVIFIHNHKLHIIECKTSVFDKRRIRRIREGKEVEEEKNINLLPEIIYKSDALRNKFGLFAITSIFTLEEIKTRDDKPQDNFKTHFDRAELSKINIVSKRDILSGKYLNEI